MVDDDATRLSGRNLTDAAAVVVRKASQQKWWSVVVVVNSAAKAKAAAEACSLERLRLRVATIYDQNGTELANPYC